MAVAALKTGWLYDRLTRNDTPQPAGLIFVFAGRAERHPYGLELYHAGMAPRLLLSIGRFEVSKMRSLSLPETDAVIAERDRTPADERHFFYEMCASGVRWQKMRLRRWSTYGEALALREYLGRELPRRMIVVSTDLHLRRIAVTMEHVFRGVPVEMLYCPVPVVHRKKWWADRATARYVLTETAKLAGYSLILMLPDALTERLMRLRN